MAHTCTSVHIAGHTPASCTASGYGDIISGLCLVNDTVCGLCGDGEFDPASS